MLQDYMRRFEQYLNAHGKRLTPAKMAVGSLVFSNRGWFAADDLVESLKDADPRVGRATVYRSISELTAAGLVSQSRHSGRYTVVGTG